MGESIETICESLVRAFQEEKDDFVSLVTIIDMYNEQVNSEKSIKEKERYLDVLLKLFKENPATLKKIGWDLPKGLLQFFSCKNIYVKKHLASSPIVSSVINCFGALALNGNPKECLLTTCELVSTLRIVSTGTDESDEEYEDLIDSDRNDATNNTDEPSIIHPELEKYTAENTVEFIPNLKIYVLSEFMSSLLKQVDTLYPSKFLAMAISAIVNYVTTNVQAMDDVHFILRIMYNFCTTYSPAQPSAILTDGIDASDLEKIYGDESVLQKKLLANLGVLMISSCLKNKPGNIDKIYFKTLMHKKLDEHEVDASILQTCYQYYEYVTSLGVDMKELLEKHLEESRHIYNSLLLNSAASTPEFEEEINQVVYEVSYAYQIKKLADEKNLEPDQYGVLILSAIHYSKNGTHLLPQIDIQSAIYLYLRCTTASLFSEIYENKFLESSVRYWLWVSITETSTKKIKCALQKLPGHITTAFLQMLLMKTCNEANNDTKLIDFTLLRKILYLMPESTSFTFMFETLLHCPYITAKIAILDILRDMMIKAPEAPNGEESVNLPEQQKSENTANSVPITPKLPPRPYVTINEDRMASIHSIALICFSVAKQKKRTQGDLLLVLTYMKFFVSLRNKWDLGLLTLINKEISESFQGEGEPELAFINIANNTLGAYIEETNIRP
ncbi:Ybp2p [Saccharomyces paradoxus]|uniref:Ybp2p n=1 Tax=Saccharomyces paradoxus TaxID=27291 RepID=A0A8B8URD5_SACPA|nr:Ybp2 [Saccharomyces paradoxus]QHS73271.1 Ybp2 [Saccharomyces paradoxus]